MCHKNLRRQEFLRYLRPYSGFGNYAAIRA